MEIEIICPLYNAEKYIVNLDHSLKTQEKVDIKKITYALTKSSDNTKQLLDDINASYIEIEKEEFSHSLTREKIAMKSDSDILVFITQDIEIKDNNWLLNLISPIEKFEAEATFSRQITKYDNIEKYTRELNYPEKSYLVSKDEIEQMGLRAFFFSDASSAIKTEIFKKLNGYDSKNLPTNEDMYIAHKLITNGYKIKYCPDSIVFHSHDFTLREIYDRYKLTGEFFKQNNYLDKYGTNKTGGGMAKYILKRAIQDKNWKVLINFLPNMLARFVGMKMGKING